MNGKSQIHSPPLTFRYHQFILGLNIHILCVLDPSSTNWEQENMLCEAWKFLDFYKMLASCCIDAERAFLPLQMVFNCENFCLE